MFGTPHTTVTQELLGRIASIDKEITYNTVELADKRASFSVFVSQREEQNAMLIALRAGYQSLIAAASGISPRA